MKVCGIDLTKGRIAEVDKNTCSGCPCTFTDESEKISNYGCLPDWNNLVESYLNNEGLWKCHAKDRVCGGLVQVLKANNIPLDKNNKLLITEDNPLIKKEKK